jgi:hypothetical protein
MVLPELQKNLKLGMAAANFKLNTFTFWPNIQISLDSELNGRFRFKIELPENCSLKLIATLIANQP